MTKRSIGNICPIKSKLKWWRKHNIELPISTQQLYITQSLRRLITYTKHSKLRDLVNLFQIAHLELFRSHQYWILHPTNEAQEADRSWMLKCRWLRLIQAVFARRAQVNFSSYAVQSPLFWSNLNSDYSGCVYCSVLCYSSCFSTGNNTFYPRAIRSDFCGAITNIFSWAPFWLARIV